MKKTWSMRPQAILSRRLAVSGLFELLAQRPYAEISISDICRQGGISRQTFYRNFDSREEIVLYYIYHLMSHFIDRAEGDMDRDLSRFFHEMPLTPDLLILLRENHLMYLLRDSVMELIRLFMKTEFYSTSLPVHGYDDYYAGYLTDTLISLLETWADRDFQDSTDDLYLLMRHFLSGRSADGTSVG